MITTSRFCPIISWRRSLKERAVLVVFSEVHVQLLLHARCRHLEHPRGRVVAVPDGRDAFDGGEVLDQELGVRAQGAGCRVNDRVLRLGSTQE